MGVKGLWPVLEEVKQVITLRSLRGQTVAIDLSGWIVQSHGLRDYKGTHQHLRNLFFKVKRFLIEGIKAVFVLDGSEPTRLKYETVRNRRSVQSGHIADTDQCDQQEGYLDASSHCGGEREGMDERIVRSKRFEQIVEQCRELLQYFGFPCIQSHHEGEALCGLLNEKKMVDAVMTDDMDAFLYGAQRVCRNLTINNHSSHQSHVDSYDMSDIEDKLSLSRGQLVCLAAMLGCDYDTKGIYGVGKIKALPLVQKFGKEDAIERFLSLEDNVDLLRGEKIKQDLSEMKKESHCSQCRHLGNYVSHKKNGCDQCQTKVSCDTEGELCNCDWHSKNSQLAQYSEPELKLRALAMETPGYPDRHRKVINEYMNSGEVCPADNFLWSKPQIDKIQNFMKKYMKWNYYKTSSHVIPCLTAWELRQKKTESSEMTPLVIPDSIISTKKKDHQDCYEVRWHKLAVDLACLEEPYYVTLECKEAFHLRFPEMAEESDEKTNLEKIKKMEEKRSVKKRKLDTKSNLRQQTIQFPQKKLQNSATRKLASKTETDDVESHPQLSISTSIKHSIPSSKIDKRKPKKVANKNSRSTAKNRKKTPSISSFFTGAPKKKQKMSLDEEVSLQDGAFSGSPLLGSDNGISVPTVSEVSSSSSACNQ